MNVDGQRDRLGEAISAGRHQLGPAHPPVEEARLQLYISPLEGGVKGQVQLWQGGERDKSLGINRTL